MMGVLNFAHASAYMLGAYFAYDISRHVGFWPALVLAPRAVRRWSAPRSRCTGCAACTGTATSPSCCSPSASRFIIEKAVQMTWGLLPVPYRVPARARLPAVHDLRHQFPRLSRLHAADLGADVRRDLARC